MQINHIKQLANILVKNKKVVSNAYNKAGHRLAAKTTLSDVHKLKGIEMPEGTVSIDLAKIEREFGKSSSNIISFKDKDGKLIKRFRTDKTPEGVYSTESNYVFGEYYSPKAASTGLFLDIRRTGKLNNELKSHTRDMVSFVKSEIEKNNQINVTHSRLDTQEFSFGGRKELQRIESWVKGDKNSMKYLETQGVRRADGRVQLTDIKGNTTTPIEEFANDPYIMIRMYPNKDFAQSIKHYLADINGVPINSINFKLKKLKNLAGYYHPATNTVVVNSNSSKANLVDTVGHEFRHKKQNIMSWHAIGNYISGFWTGNTGNKRENLLGLYFFRGNGKSLLSLNGRIEKFYYGSPLEIDAFKAGDRFRRKYIRLSENLNNEFPYASSSQFGLDGIEIHLKNSWSEHLKELLKNAKVVTSEVPIFIKK